MPPPSPLSTKNVMLYSDPAHDEHTEDLHRCGCCKTSDKLKQMLNKFPEVPMPSCKRGSKPVGVVGPGTKCCTNTGCRKNMDANVPETPVTPKVPETPKHEAYNTKERHPSTYKARLTCKVDPLPSQVVLSNSQTDPSSPKSVHRRINVIMPSQEPSKNQASELADLYSSIDRIKEQMNQNTCYRYQSPTQYQVQSPSPNMRDKHHQELKKEKTTGMEKLWTLIREIIWLVHLAVTATALAVYYIIYCYMQLIYFTLQSVMYFHRAEVSMKITLTIVTITTVVIGLNILKRVETVMGFKGQ